MAANLNATYKRGFLKEEIWYFASKLVINLFNCTMQVYSIKHIEAGVNGSLSNYSKTIIFSTAISNKADRCSDKYYHQGILLFFETSLSSLHIDIPMYSRYDNSVRYPGYPAKRIISAMRRHGG